MSYSPVLPLGGYGGWTFLKRTMVSQTAAFNASSDLKRDEDYFRARIGKINSAEELVSDRRLLKIALGAYGLDADINSKAFIRKVLEDGTLKVGTLANRLADKQYQKLSAAFGFGDFAVPRSKLSDFPDKIISAYRARQFEVAVGDQSGDMRLALNAERELVGIASKTTSSEDAKWFTVMGNAPLRQVFEKALGLPKSLGTLDLDQQLGVFKAKAEAQLGSGSVTQFTDPAKVQGLIRRFLLRSEAQAMQGQIGAGASALTLMQQSVALSRRR
jgi:hypothetical protein